MSLSLKKKVIVLLQEYKDVFAWSSKDIPDISSEINVQDRSKQKRKIYPKRQHVRVNEVGMLLKAEIVFEVLGYGGCTAPDASVRDGRYR